MNAIENGLPKGQRFPALAAVLFGIGAAVFDGVSVNLALPTVSAEFAVSEVTATWVINAYQIAIITALLPLSALGEKIGYKRVYLGGLVLLATMAVVAALAPSYPILIVARILQGLGAACAMSVNLALIRHIFPRERLGQALGINATVVAVIATLSPTIAGGIMTIAPWQGIFAVTVLSVSVAVALGSRVLPSPMDPGRLYDIPSAVLSATTFGSLLMAISGFGHDWSPLAVAALLASGLAAGATLTLRQKGRVAPLLPVDLLRIPVFSLSLCVSICGFCAQMLAYVSLPFFLQDRLSIPVFEVGLVFACWPLGIGMVAPFAGWLSDRVAPGLLGAFGLTLLAFGLGALALAGLDSGPWDMAWRMLVCGAGFAMFQSPNNRTLVGSAPRNRSAAASGALATARLLGQALGTALATFALGQTFAPSIRLALVMAFCFALIGAVVSALRRGHVMVE